MLIAALIGFAFGFVGSMPIAGPITALIFVRSLDRRYRSAVLVGMGSVLAETAYAFLAFWGFASLLADYTWLEPASQALGAVILLGLGVAFLRRDPEATAPPAPAGADARSFLTGLTISGLNPTLLATWAGAAATLYGTGLVAPDPDLAWPFALGAGAGIGSWYLVLVRLVRRYRDRFSQAALNRVIRYFGGFLLAVSAVFVWRFVDTVTGA